MNYEIQTENGLYKRHIDQIKPRVQTNLPEVTIQDRCRNEEPIVLDVPSQTSMAETSDEIERVLPPRTTRGVPPKRLNL